MLNGIAASFVAWVIRGPLRYADTRRAAFNVNLRTDPFPDNAAIPRPRTPLRDPARASASRGCSRWRWSPRRVVWFLFKRMRLGYEARAVGASPGSALAGGISIGKVQIKLFLISGALAGLIGMQQLFADQGFLPSGYEAGIGFIGIGVAFLGQNNPVGIVFAAMLWGDPGARGDLAAAPDRRATRVRDHPAGHPDLVGRGDLPDRQATAVRAATAPAAEVEDFEDAEAPDADIEGLAKEDR